MGRKCSICQHPKVYEINQAIIAGDPYRDIAQKYGVSKDALYRHARSHLPKTLSKAYQARESAQGDDLLKRAKEYEDKAVQLLKKAEQAEDFSTALRGVREARASLELLAKMRGELEQAGNITVNIDNHPQWIEIKAVMLTALEPYPEAKAAVYKAITDARGS